MSKLTFGNQNDIDRIASSVKGGPSSKMMISFGSTPGKVCADCVHFDPETASHKPARCGVYARYAKAKWKPTYAACGKFEPTGSF